MILWWLKWHNDTVICDQLHQHYSEVVTNLNCANRIKMFMWFCIDWKVLSRLGAANIVPNIQNLNRNQNRRCQWIVCHFTVNKVIDPSRLSAPPTAISRHSALCSITWLGLPSYIEKPEWKYQISKRFHTEQATERWKWNWMQNSLRGHCSLLWGHLVASVESTCAPIYIAHY